MWSEKICISTTDYSYCAEKLSFFDNKIKKAAVESFNYKINSPAPCRIISILSPVQSTTVEAILFP